MKKAKIHPFDIEELACKITGLDYDEIDADSATIQDEIYERFGCDLDQFTEIIAHLLPLIDVGESPLTKKRYKGFSDIENGVWITKMEIEN